MQIQVELPFFWSVFWVWTPPKYVLLIPYWQTSLSLEIGEIFRVHWETQFSNHSHLGIIHDLRCQQPRKNIQHSARIQVVVIEKMVEISGQNIWTNIDCPGTSRYPLAKDSMVSISTIFTTFSLLSDLNKLPSFLVFGVYPYPQVVGHFFMVPKN
jgi:hypothetical protein